MYNTISKPGAWICSNDNDHQNRGRLKIYQPGSKIYLNDKDEFEIELYNPTSNNVRAEIIIDDKPISKGGIVVMKGERIYLECFPDNKKKFTFRTYKVENTKEVSQAIRNNGNILINFYQEYVPPINYTYPLYNTSGTVNLSNINGVYHNPSDSYSTTFYNTGRVGYSTTVETGQVSGGKSSSQSFQEVDMTFNSDILCSYSFKILPMSQKPLDKKEFRVKKSKNRSSSDKLDRLLKLSELYQNNLVTKDEFDKLKSEII